MKQIQLVAITPEDLKNEITKEIKVILNEFSKHLKPAKPEKYLTRTEVAEIFSINISTVNNWTKKGILKPLGIGCRVYFLRSDIENALVSLNQ